MVTCRTGCPTQDHSSWGECARASSMRIGWANSASGLDLTAEKKHRAELDAYRSARSAGIQPDSTRIGAVRRAVEISEKTGTPYGVSNA